MRDPHRSRDTPEGLQLVNNPCWSTESKQELRNGRKKPLCTDPDLVRCLLSRYSPEGGGAGKEEESRWAAAEPGEGEREGKVFSLSVSVIVCCLCFPMLESVIKSLC